jgi:predicted RNase H-like HicB family nuclease
MKIKAIIHPAEEGGYWAEVPALPGWITEGDSLEEVTHNLKDAIKGWLAVANESYEIKSFIGTSEVEDLKNALGKYVLYEKIIKRQQIEAEVSQLKDLKERTTDQIWALIVTVMGATVAAIIKFGFLTKT